MGCVSLWSRNCKNQRVVYVTFSLCYDDQAVLPIEAAPLARMETTWSKATVNS